MNPSSSVFTPLLPSSSLSLSDYDYFLPEDLIAKYPLSDRPRARLLHLDRKQGTIAHRHFFNLTDFLKAGDVLVLNNTKVLAARLLGERSSGGKVETLLLSQESDPQNWKALIKPGGKIRKGEKICFKKANCRIFAEIMNDAIPDSGERILRFSEPDLMAKLPFIGWMPIPPYLKRPSDDTDFGDYQTIFAEVPGAVAAPTAGLHFNEALLSELAAKGVEIVYVTLQVGYGTFQPVYEEDFSKHEMHIEAFEINQEASDAINRAKAEGRRVIACGTTVVRVLESAAVFPGKVEARSGKTQLFIYPPFAFRMIDGLITNFHVPRSTLLLLVSAFGGHSNVMKAYQEAIRERYRFFSYGDAMIIL